MHYVAMQQSEIIIEHSGLTNALVSAQQFVPHKNKQLFHYYSQHLNEAINANWFTPELKKYSENFITPKDWEELCDLATTMLKVHSNEARFDSLARVIKRDFDEAFQRNFEDEELYGLINLALAVTAIELIQSGEATLGQPRGRDR